MYILCLTQAQQHLAEVQSRLDENLDAWASADKGARFVAEPCAGSMHLKLQEVEISLSSASR